MKDYTEIKSPDELERFLHEKVTFHDGMLKEMQIINRGYVMKNKSMNMDHRFDAKLLFQTQWDPIAFELVCIGVNHFNATGPEEFMGSSGRFIDSPEQLIELSLDGDFIIQCKQLFYKITPELHGNNEHLGSQVPSTEMVSATKLDRNWRQCGECSNAWEVSPEIEIATCPSCDKVTCTSVKGSGRLSAHAC